MGGSAAAIGATIDAVVGETVSATGTDNVIVPTGEGVGSFDVGVVAGGMVV